MFLSILIHSNYLFKTLTQSFYIALSHISIRTRNMKYTGVTISRAGGVQEKNVFSKKSHSAENCRTVPKMSHSISLYIETKYSPGITECYWLA